MKWPMISDYPAPKIYLACSSCGLAVQYDREALLQAGGDRKLIEFRLDVARRMGCAKVDRTAPDLRHFNA